MPPFLAPLLAGIAAAVVTWHWSVYPTLDAAGSVGLGGTVASISTTMLGFMLAASAVLASINHTHLVDMMRKYGHYRDLLITMMIGCMLFMTCAVFGFAMLFGLPSSAVLLCLLISVHVSALVSLIDVGRKLWYVLSSLKSS